jgi:hypothetical protein
MNNKNKTTQEYLDTVIHHNHNDISKLKLKYINNIDVYKIRDKYIYIFGEDHIKYNKNDKIDNSYGIKYLQHILEKKKNNSVLYLEVYHNIDIYKNDKFDFNSDNINYMLNLKKNYNFNNIYLSDYRNDYLDINFITLLYNTDLYNNSINTKYINNILINSLSNNNNGLFMWLKSDKYKYMYDLIPDYINNMNNFIKIATEYITILSIHRNDIINKNNFKYYSKFLYFLKYYFLNINDFFILRDILFRNINYSYILIGDKHAENMRRLLNNFLINKI